MEGRNEMEEKSAKFLEKLQELLAMAKKKKNRRKISLKTVYLIKQFMPYFKKYKYKYAKNGRV